LKAIGVTLVLAVVGTTIIAYIVKMLIGLRPSADVEYAGLDISEHGEEGYHSDGSTGNLIPSGHHSSST
jgi:Amt family ammonium transporter